MVLIAQIWELDVQRGPDWLFVRPRVVGREPAAHSALAEQIWTLLEQNFTHRLVLELDGITLLQSSLLGELVQLHKRICAVDGLMRVTGLSPRNAEVLRIAHLDGRLPCFDNRTDAVMAARTGHPR